MGDRVVAPESDQWGRELWLACALWGLVIAAAEGIGIADAVFRPSRRPTSVLELRAVWDCLQTYLL